MLVWNIGTYRVHCSGVSFHGHVSSINPIQIVWKTEDFCKFQVVPYQHGNKTNDATTSKFKQHLLDLVHLQMIHVFFLCALSHHQLPSALAQRWRIFSERRPAWKSSTTQMSWGFWVSWVLTARHIKGWHFQRMLSFFTQLFICQDRNNSRFSQDYKK